ncbi:hypothetical protein NA57DRAFT_70129 [Rhizodiscina lignyota]|uniref:F-box domain-containing protein n=1 Tax=Rhizodiscina lignyota TaxID=1504668 RepID=A0A9P4MDY0_9PEZI|nr:hypothetical protein NA57DRAFT_70129 [Rhizodiscina lignyota]
MNPVTLDPAMLKSKSSTHAGSHQMFHIPEILKIILMELPLKDLVRVQAVSPYWKDTIEKSIKLLRALFLAPDPTRTGLTPNHTFPKKIRHSSCLDIKFNPLLTKTAKYGRQKVVIFDPQSQTSKSPPNASWARMSLLQSRITNFEIKYFHHFTLRDRKVDLQTLALTQPLLKAHDLVSSVRSLPGAESPDGPLLLLLQLDQNKLVCLSLGNVMRWKDFEKQFRAIADGLRLLCQTDQRQRSFGERKIRFAVELRRVLCGFEEAEEELRALVSAMDAW